jgi:hypothetical protein
MHLCEDLEQSLNVIYSRIMQLVAVIQLLPFVSDEYILVEQMTSSSSLSKFAQVPDLVTDGEVPGLYLCWARDYRAAVFARYHTVSPEKSPDNNSNLATIFAFHIIFNSLGLVIRQSDAIQCVSEAYNSPVNLHIFFL